MKDKKVEQLIPNSADGVLKNLADIAEEHRKDNLRCLMVCFRRNDEETVRTFFVGANDPYMFKTLVRLEHDMLGLYADDVSHIIEYLDEE